MYNSRLRSQEASITEVITTIICAIDCLTQIAATKSSETARKLCNHRGKGLE